MFCPQSQQFSVLVDTLGNILFLAIAAEITSHITTWRRDFSTWQHNPASSSSAMTHISLPSSRRGGAQNHTLPWKIPFEGTCWGLAEKPSFLGWGVAWADTVTLPNLFWSQQRDAVQWDSTASLSLKARSLSSPPAGQFVQPSLVVSQSINKSVPCPRTLNSPGSCCPGESRWGYCWGWMTGRVLLWCGEPPRFLKRSRQFRQEGQIHRGRDGCVVCKDSRPGEINTVVLNHHEHE